MSFGLFWAIAINVILFFHRLSIPISPRIYKSQLLFTFMAISLVLFGLKKTKQSIPIVLFMLLAFFNQHLIVSKDVILQWFYFTIGCVFFIQCQIINTKDIKYLEKGFFIASIISSIWLILNYFRIEPMFILEYFLPHIKIVNYTGEHLKNIPIAGALHNSMISAALPACCIPFFFTKKRKWWLPLPIMAVLMASSATALGSMFVAIFVCLCKKVSRETIMVLVTFIICMAVCMPTDFWSIGTRYEVWSLLKQDIKWDWLGHGLGYFKFAYFTKTFKLVKEGYTHPHNEYINLYICFGVVGLSYLAYLITKIKTYYWRYTACFIAFLVNGLGSFPFHISPLIAIIILTYSVSIIGDKNENNDFNINATIP